MSRLGSLLPALVAGALGLALTGSAWSASTARWHTQGQTAFEKGELDGVLVSSEGYVALATVFEKVHEAESSILLSLAPSPDKKYLFYGDGDTGSVFRLDLATGKAEAWYVSDEVYAKALVSTPDALFMATAPEGRVYRVLGPDEAEAWFTPEEDYLWSLAQGRDGTLYAGVGTPGRVYKLDGEGNATLLFETADAYVTALSAPSSGALYAGTYNEAITLRLDPDGKAFALYDSELAQVTAIREASDKALYLAAASVEEPVQQIVMSKASSEASETPQEKEDETVVTVHATPAAKRKMESHVYRIAPDGSVTQMADFPDATAYDIALAPDGALWVATGEPARLYDLRHIPGRKSTKSLVAEFEAGQVSALAYVDKTLYAATSHPGAIYRATSGSRAEGIYTSEVHDMGALVRWGEISWIAETAKGAAIQLFVRCGNVSEPDATWSEWLGPYARKKGVATACPPSRFAQWKAQLKGESAARSPLLKGVTLTALPFNAMPEVTYIQIHDPGVIFAPPKTAEDPVDKFLSGDETTLLKGKNQKNKTATGRKLFKRGMRTLQWYAKDANGDALAFQVFYRREGTHEWLPLKDELDETMFAWDTLSVADGLYQVKVTASDAPSNFLGLAQEGENVSDFFVVDNTPPEVKVKETNHRALRFRVRDEWSPLKEVQVAFEPGEWQAVPSQDGVLDGLEESFDVELPSGRAFPSIGIKAIDKSNNIETLYVPLPE